MKPPRFAYHDPVSIEEALDLLARLDNALVLAGGQSLLPMLNFRVAAPDHLIDLGRIHDLAGIDVAPGRGRFGAMTRQRDLEFSPDVARVFPVMAEALAHVGHRQTRNRGTFGGSLCHLDPAAELVVVAALHDAVMQVAGPAGVRRIAMADWAEGLMTTALGEGEILTAIEMQAWPPGHGFAFEEFARRHGDFAIAAVGCLVALAADGTVARVRLCVSGLAPAPVPLAAAEALLVGQIASVDRIAAVASAARAIAADDDALVSAAYRKHLAGVLTRRALTRACERAGLRRAA